MKGRRSFIFMGLALLTLLLAFSCSLATDNVLSGTGVSLYIDDSGLSRFVAVDEFDVTSLDITLRNGDEVMHTFTWVPHTDNSRIYIPILTAGTFDIDVTHNGIKGDETVSVTENAKFRIKLGIITIIKIVPGMVGAIDVEPIEEPDPIDLTGFWDVTWFFDGGVEFGPLYTYMNHTGNQITMPYGMSATLDGDTFTMTGFIPDPFGIVEATGVADNENEIEGDIKITDIDGNIVDWGFGPMVGTSLMVRSDPANFGHLDITGSAVTADGTTVMDLDTEWAMASTSIDSEEWTDENNITHVSEWENLKIGYTTDVNDMSLWIQLDTSSGRSFGENQSYDFPWPGPAGIMVRYLVEGLGFDESSSMDESLFFGTLYIDEWNVVQDPNTGQVVGGHVSGRVETTGPNPMTANFNVPLTPQGAFG